MSEFLYKIEQELKRRDMSRGQRLRRAIGIPLLAVMIPLVLGELILRLIGYTRPHIRPQFQQRLMQASANALNERFSTQAFIPDDYLLWRLKPGENLAGLIVDDLGLLGTREPADPFSRKRVRLLCLGDSVTALTYRTWPSRVERLARMAPGGPTLEVYNAAVPGYTTEQGLRRMEQLGKLQSDVVVACFGWNDQFPALSVPDRELGYASAFTRGMHRIFGGFRLYQLLTASAEARTVRRSGGDSAGGTRALRVSPEQFHVNLRAFVAEVRATRALPVLATQPENLGEATERHLKSSQFVAGDEGAAVELHRQYNDIVRRVAQELQVPLVDLEEEFLRRRREHFFEADGMHLTSRGHNHIARLILALLREEGLITPEHYELIAASERHDSTAPDKPRAAWSVVPPHMEVFTTETLTFAVIARNAGNTRWLKQHTIPKLGTRTHVPYGSVNVTGQWRTVNSPTTGTAVQARLPGDILPGETTSVTLSLAAPPQPGNYEMEIGLRAEGIGDLKQFGSETTTLTVTVR